MGLGRFIVVAETDAAALALARRAYPKWHESFTHLHRLHGRLNAHPRPPSFDGLADVGQGIAGSPATVAAFLRAQLGGTGSNYCVGQFAFGDLTLAETLQSIELFARHVMPELAGADARPSHSGALLPPLKTTFVMIDLSRLAGSPVGGWGEGPVLDYPET